MFLEAEELEEMMSILFSSKKDKPFLSLYKELGLELLTFLDDLDPKDINYEEKKRALDAIEKHKEQLRFKKNSEGKIY